MRATRYYKFVTLLDKGWRACIETELVKYPDTKGTSRLDQRHLDLGGIPVEPGVEAEGGNFVSREPVWIGRSAQVLSHHANSTSEAFLAFSKSPRRGLLGNQVAANTNSRKRRRLRGMKRAGAVRPRPSL